MFLVASKFIISSWLFMIIGMSGEPLSRRQVCHMWDRVCREVVQTRELWSECMRCEYLLEYYHQSIPNTFISIVIVDPKFLVLANVVTPVARNLAQLACCVGADPSLVGTLFVEERVRRLRLNVHHSSLKPGPVILSIAKVKSQHEHLMLYLTTFSLLSKLKKSSSTLGKVAVYALPSRKFTK